MNNSEQGREDEIIGDLKDKFRRGDLKNQHNAKFSVSEILGAISLAYYRGKQESTPPPTVIHPSGLQRISELRDELYNSIPSGQIDAFELIKVISAHIKKLDALLEEETTPHQPSGLQCDGKFYCQSIVDNGYSCVTQCDFCKPKSAPPEEEGESFWDKSMAYLNQSIKESSLPIGIDELATTYAKTDCYDDPWVDGKMTNYPFINEIKKKIFIDGFKAGHSALEKSECIQCKMLENNFKSNPVITLLTNSLRLLNNYQIKCLADSLYERLPKETNHNQDIDDAIDDLNKKYYNE